MTLNVLEVCFSAPRMEPYQNKHKDLEKAKNHYFCNIELSEAFYPSICFFEIALRNALNRQLTLKFSTEDYFGKLSELDKDLTKDNSKKIGDYLNEAKNKIKKKKENKKLKNIQITPSEVISELTLGFWVSLLNKKYENNLWKDIRKAFPYLEKSQRIRKNVLDKIDPIRKLRNRIFHHEPICWDLNKVIENHNYIILVLGWIHKELPIHLSKIDRFEDVVENIQKKLI